MTVAAGTIGRPRRGASTALTAVLLAGGSFLGWQIVAGGPMLRVLLAAVVMGVLALPAIRRPRAALLGLFAILPFLGIIRHAFVGATGAAVLDPLLLIPTAVVVTVFFSLALSQRMRFAGTPLATVMFLLMGLSLLQVFNPGQGSILVGLSGVMINLVPMSLFFVARTIADEAMTKAVLRVVMVAGAAVAAYGLVQVFVGFRGFEKAWIESQGFQALTIADTVRPFSTFNNAAEYATYVHYAFVAMLAAVLFGTKARRVWMVALAGMVVYSGFLIGSRGFTVKVIVAVAVLLAARARNRLLALGFGAAVIALAALWVASTPSSDEKFADKEPGVEQLVFNQVRALADPFDPKKSTLPSHFNQFRGGVAGAFTKAPFGLGTGATTRGGAKFGGVQGGGTELDIGDAFVSLGIAGGVLYCLAIFLALRQTSRLRRMAPGRVWVTVWAMALTSVGVWLIGGLYAIAPLIWFLIGAADGAYMRARVGSRERARDSVYEDTRGGAYEGARDLQVAGSTLPV